MIHATSTATPTLHYTNRTGTYHHSLSTPVFSLSFLAPSPYLLVVSQDWRASVFSLNTILPSSTSLSSIASPLWEREEALAAVVKTEIVELPPGIPNMFFFLSASSIVVQNLFCNLHTLWLQLMQVFEGSTHTQCTKKKQKKNIKKTKNTHCKKSDIPQIHHGGKSTTIKLFRFHSLSDATESNQSLGEPLWLDILLPYGPGFRPYRETLADNYFPKKIDPVGEDLGPLGAHYLSAWVLST
jgi:hypothetical protein